MFVSGWLHFPQTYYGEVVYQITDTILKISQKIVTTLYIPL